MKLIALIFSISIFNVSYGQQNDGFGKFETQLKQIALNEDLAGLKSIMHDTIFESNDICGYPGCIKEEFFKFHFTNDSLSEDWKLLREALEIGFVKIDNDSAIVLFSKVSEVYEAPSYWRNVDINKELQVIEKNTVIKEKPNINSNTLMVVDSGKFTCNCCIYNQKENDRIKDENGNTWIRIELKNQTVGYVKAKNTSQRRKKILEIGKINGKWKIIAFYSGEPC